MVLEVVDSAKESKKHTEEQRAKLQAILTELEAVDKEHAELSRRIEESDGGMVRQNVTVTAAEDNVTESWVQCSPPEYGCDPSIGPNSSSSLNGGVGAEGNAGDTSNVGEDNSTNQSTEPTASWVQCAPPEYGYGETSSSGRSAPQVEPQSVAIRGNTASNANTTTESESVTATRSCVPAGAPECGDVIATIAISTATPTPYIAAQPTTKPSEANANNINNAVSSSPNTSSAFGVGAPDSRNGNSTPIQGSSSTDSLVRQGCAQTSDTGSPVVTRRSPRTTYPVGNVPSMSSSAFPGSSGYDGFGYSSTGPWALSSTAQMRARDTDTQREVDELLSQMEEENKVSRRCRTVRDCIQPGIHRLSSFYP